MYWLCNVIFSFLIKLAIKFHTNPWSGLVVSLSTLCNNHEISCVGRLLISKQNCSFLYENILILDFPIDSKPRP